MMNKYKTCSKCNMNQPIQNFSKDRYKHDGYHQKCKVCTREYKRQYYQINKERLQIKNKEYEKSHLAEQYVRNNKYKATHRDKVRNADNIRKRRDYQINPSKYNGWHQNYLNTHPEARLASKLRIRLRQAIKDNQKVGSAVRDLGCSIDFLKKYIESKFQSGMSWKNYGRFGWHIDHIIPLDSFDLTKRQEFLEANNYTNLQPLWAFDNLHKSNKMIGEQHAIVN